MGLSMFASLLLVGSWAALAAFLAGDRLRKRAGSALPQFTRRTGGALALLGLAGLAGVAAVVQGSVDEVFPAYAALALWFAGLGATLWAFRAGPPAEGEAATGPRMTRRGWTALALLSGAQVTALLNDRLVDTFRQFQVQARALSLALGALGLIFLALGTGGAARTFLAGSAVPGGRGTALRWLPATPRWTLTALAVALAVLFLANALVPTPGCSLGLVLLVLGTGTGLFAYVCDAGVRAKDEPAWLRISPRSWVSLGLLALAMGVLTFEQARAWAGREAAGADLARAGSEPDPAAEADLAKLRRRLAEKQRELDALGRTPGDGRGWDSIPGSPGPDAVVDRENPGPTALEQEVRELKDRLARMEGGRNRVRPGRSFEGPKVTDLDDWSRKPGPGGRDDRSGSAESRRAHLEKEVEELRDTLRQKETKLKGEKVTTPSQQATSVNLASWNGRARGGRYAGR